MEPFKALLVEGTSGVGKSTLIDALLRRHLGFAGPRRIRSLLHLAQTHTYGPLAPGEDDKTLTVDENVRHLERVVATLDWLHAAAQEHSRPMCYVVIDTLHLTHCVRPGIVKWGDVEAFDRRLASIRCKLLFLRADPATIWDRGIRTRANEKFLLDYAKKFGSTQEQIHNYFVREQETLSTLFSLSAMSKLSLPSEAASEITLWEAYRFWSNEDG